MHLWVGAGGAGADRNAVFTNYDKRLVELPWDAMRAAHPQLAAPYSWGDRSAGTRWLAYVLLRQVIDAHWAAWQLSEPLAEELEAFTSDDWEISRRQLTDWVNEAIIEADPIPEGRSMCDALPADQGGAGPPPEAAGTYVPFVTADPGFPLEGVALSDCVQPLWTHWIFGEGKGDKGRRYRCAGEAAGCVCSKQAVSRRWSCYILLWQTAVSRAVLAEVPLGAAKPWKHLLFGPGRRNLTGEGMRLIRMGTRRNSPVRLEWWRTGDLKIARAPDWAREYDLPERLRQRFPLAPTMDEPGPTP